MMIKDNQDLYEKARQTVSRLDQAGFHSEADKIRKALEISSMPGEVLGELRLVLCSIDKEKLDMNIVEEVEIEINYINSVLN